MNIIDKLARFTFIFQNYTFISFHRRFRVKHEGLTFLYFYCLFCKNSDFEYKIEDKQEFNSNIFQINAVLRNKILFAINFQALKLIQTLYSLIL